METLVEVSQRGIIALGQEVETEAGDVVESFVSLHPRQAKRRPAFEREQIARVAKELCDHVVGFGL